MRIIWLQVGMSSPVGGGAVSNRPELATEFQLLLFGCWAGHSVAEKCPVAVVSGLGFQCTREEGVGRCGLGAKGGES